MLRRKHYLEKRGHMKLRKTSLYGSVKERFIQ
jgi:hypothetical protein